MDITVTLPDGRQGRVEGTIGEGDDGPAMAPGEAAAAWLALIDPGELEREVMARTTYGSAPPIQTALAVLQAWAQGRVAGG